MLDLIVRRARFGTAAVAHGPPLWGLKAGRMTFRRERPVLLPP